MTMQAPEFFSQERAYDAKDTVSKGQDAAAMLRDMARAKAIEPIKAEDDGYHSYLSPVHPNTRFLARAGTVVLAPYTGQSLGLQPAVRRDNDVWVEFHSGVCSTKEPQELEWLEAHSGYPDAHVAYHQKYGQDPRDCEVPIGLCREMGPGIDVWAELKAGQEPTATRPATISKDIDVDAFMRGDYSRGNRSLQSGVGRAMEDAAQNNRNASQSKGIES